ELTAPPEAGWRARNRALWRRHAIRRQRAEETLAEAFSPERGLPVARTRDVLDFIGGLLAERKALVAAVVIANAIAAAASLIVPMLLGRLVDATIAARGDVAGATIRNLTMLVVAVVVGQTLFTFAAKWLATVLGHGALAAARE